MNLFPPIPPEVHLKALDINIKTHRSRLSKVREEGRLPRDLRAEGTIDPLVSILNFLLALFIPT